MKGKKQKKTARRLDKSSIEIIEEATHLLRLMPLNITALYFIGGLPFVLGILYFVADMSKNAFAYEHDAESVFSIVLLFLWMKCWQAVFCNHVRAFLAGAASPKWSLLEIIRLCVTQTAIQPIGLIVLPIASLITLPFGYAFAFFQNVSLIGDGKSSGLKPVYRKALDQTKIFPRQNHALLLLIALFSFFIFVNIIAVMYAAPHLVKMFTGIETDFTLVGWGLFNTTFFTAAVALTYLAIDPLVKTVYALRCFYGESLNTGEDLKIDLQRLRPASLITALLIACCLMMNAASSVAADAGIPAQIKIEKTALPVSDLDRSLSDTISKREYAWRLPRQKAEKKKDRGPFAAFLDGVIETVGNWISTVEEWIHKELKWIYENLLKRMRFNPSGDDKSWTGSTTLLLYILGAAAVCLIGILIWQTLGRRKTGTVELSGEALAPARDLTSEDVTADELPSNEWIALAREMAQKGDLRLALRALYLGSLAQLAYHGIVSIAKYKSNHDYEKEVSRRAAESAGLISEFSESIGIFESVWYGMHDISAEGYEEFSRKHERIMTLADRY